MNDDWPQLLRAARVVPVLTIERTADATPLADALASGGLEVLEITLRTPVALEAIRRLRAERPRLLIGAGTVLSPAGLDAAAEAGAAFAVSPGSTPALLAAGRRAKIPFVPAVATASEAMLAREAGYRLCKFFPAQELGGVATLRAFGAPLPDLDFVASGGITAANAPTYLALPNVACVGGSWMAPAEAVRGGDWSRIAALARASLERREP
jgi:2-dehydro-3-deoxyphosphogluconate aldolase/(4S)-4-hydroxy-2-oxoglutarate aldolase